LITVDSRNRSSSFPKASVLLGAALLLASFQAAADLDVKVRLLLDGKDVTSEHGDDLVRFIPHSRGPDSQALPELGCSVDRACPVPPGAYSVDLESEGVIVEARPKLLVGAEDEGLAVVTLSLSPAANVTVSGLPKGGMLQALDERLGVLHSRLVYGPTARLRIPARSVILCAHDPKGRPLGCWPVVAKPGETIALAGLPKLVKGRGQLFVDLVYPARDVAHDVSVALRRADLLAPPDAVVKSHPDRHFAVWYDVPAGPASLEVVSPNWAVGGPVAVTVPDQAISTKRAIPLVRRGAPK
jgi:hypothetical protein